MSGTVSITRLERPGDENAEMGRNVREGLLAEPKDLSPWPKYFYDAEGSRLFEEITELPEYYQTRAELSILREKAEEIVTRSRCREIVELGSGSASKTHPLLEAMLDRRTSPPRYVPLDVSESALQASGEGLLKEYPELEIEGYVGDFEGSLERVLNGRAGPEEAKLVIFLGGTIGNFTPEKRREFLKGVRSGLRDGDHFLLGVDLAKDARILEAAYNDAAGVTERFNKNLLRVINEKLGGEFDPDLFEHRALYKAEKERVEMWLVSKANHKVRVSELDLEVTFGVGEGMRTEISAKFAPGSVRRIFDDAGFGLLELYTDDKNLFGLAFGAARV